MNACLFNVNDALAINVALLINAVLLGESRSVTVERFCRF